jgi:hypothetical protein
MLFRVLFVCKCVLPPGVNPFSVNKYIISHIIYHIHTYPHGDTAHKTNFIVRNLKPCTHYTLLQSKLKPIYLDAYSIVILKLLYTVQ